MTPVPVLIEDDDMVATAACRNNQSSLSDHTTAQQHLLAYNLSSEVDSFQQSMDKVRYMASRMITTEAARVNKRLLSYRQQLAQEVQQETEVIQEQQQQDNKRRKVMTLEQEAQEANQESSKTENVQHAQQQEDVLYHQASRSHRMIQLFRQMEQIQDRLLDDIMACADDEDLRQAV